MKVVATGFLNLKRGIMYEKIYDYNNLLLAWKKTQRLKKYRDDVMQFRSCLDENLINIQNELIWKTYKVSDYKHRTVFEPKKRLISALPLRDRVVQHALVNHVEPILDRQFIFDSHACRTGHGVKLAVDRFIKFSKKNRYCLKCDIKSYFFTINHDILKSLYREKLDCPDTLWLIDNILDSTPNPGLPIGNLVSQLSANLYLHELDFNIKHTFGYSDYLRYMDDFVIFGDSRESLEQTKKLVRLFLQEKLNLTLSEEKSRIYETKNGVEFCGFRCYPGFAKIRKATVKRNGKRIAILADDLQTGKITPEKFGQSLNSIIGHSMYSRNYSYRKNISDKLEAACITK
jgi:retron-type reverse transcriptase